MASKKCSSPRQKGNARVAWARRLAQEGPVLRRRDHRGGSRRARSASYLQPKARGQGHFSFYLRRCGFGPGLRCGGFGAGTAQEFDQFLTVHAAQLDEEKWIAVEFLTQQIVDGGDMFAGVRPVRARAVRLQILELGREERQPRILEHLLNVLRHLTSQEFSRKDRLLGQDLRQGLPVTSRQRLEQDGHTVGLGPRSLHLRFDPTLLDGDG